MFKTSPGTATTNSISPANSKPSSVNVAASTKSKKQSSIHGQPIPNLISFGSQQIATNQNVKPMAKKNSRKDPTPGICHSGTASIIPNKSGPSPPLGKSCTNVEN